MPSATTRPRRSWPQRIVLIFNCLVVVGALVAAGLVWFANDKLSETRRVPINSIDAADLTTVPGTAAAGSTVPGETTSTLDLGGDVAVENYLLVGSDSRACIDPNSPYAGAFLTEGNDIGDRSDTIMVLRVDPDESQAAILSFPRDLWVKIGSTNRKSRINSAFDKDDPSRLVDTIQQNFLIPINHYIEVDFCAFKYLVDAIGGVTIPFAYPTRDRYTGLNVEAPGCVAMTGDEALAYVRSRHYEYFDGSDWEDDGSSDRGRIRRQQDFIKRMLAKAISRGASRPDVARNLIETALDNVRIDEDLTINDMLKVASRLRSFDPSEVKTYRMDGKGTNIGGASVIVPDLTSEATRNVLRLFRGEVAVADVPETETTEPTSTATTGASTATTGTTVASVPASTTAASAAPGGAIAPPSTVVLEDNGVGIYPPEDQRC